MPPKRSRPAPPAAPKPSKKRPSKLAKENNLSADQESEIREAFALFAIQHPDYEEDAKTGVLKTDDVRRCLIALNTPPASSSELQELLETLDPNSAGYVSYEHFIAVAALKLHAKTTSPDALDAELEAAFTLFTKGEGELITLAHLKRVAKELREDVSDATLKDMLREAHGGPGGGVSLEDFEDVMRRAGVFG